MAKDIDTLTENLLNTLNPKQKRILKERYGIGGKKKTLQGIGDSLGITRERVRQIENQSLKKIKAETLQNFGAFIDAAEKHLRTIGGVREDNLFIEEVARLTDLDTSPKNWKPKTRLIFSAAARPLYSKENPDSKSYWYLNETANNQFQNFIAKTIETFETTAKAETLNNQNFLSKLKAAPEYNSLFISKKFGQNSFGDIGLIKWPEIKPKNVRDKAYLALKKTCAPLHFRDIAKQIIKIGVSPKPVNTQTVHNELIKDKRFVLVGRGIYALKENGYETGTVREVITSLLGHNGPLASHEVVKLVNQQRLLKENTVLLNLQNRKHFKRLDDGRYTLRGA